MQSQWIKYILKLTNKITPLSTIIIITPSVNDMQQDCCNKISYSYNKIIIHTSPITPLQQIWGFSAMQFHTVNISDRPFNSTWRFWVTKRNPKFTFLLVNIMTGHSKRHYWKKMNAVILLTVNVVVYYNDDELHMATDSRRRAQCLFRITKQRK